MLRSYNAKENLMCEQSRKWFYAWQFFFDNNPLSSLISAYVIRLLSLESWYRLKPPYVVYCTECSSSSSLRSPWCALGVNWKMKWTMNNSFGFGNFREISQNFATISSNLHIVLHFLKTFAKVRQKLIEIELTDGKKFSVKSVNIRKIIFEIEKRLRIFAEILRSDSEQYKNMYTV